MTQPTQQESLAMAREDGFDVLSVYNVDHFTGYIDEVVRLVAAAYARGVADEREACAMVCDELTASDEFSKSEQTVYDVATLDCAETIRNRSNQ